MHHPDRRPHRFTGVLTLLTALLALVGAAAPATAATDPTGPGDGTVTWAVQPASADGPDGRISLRHVLDPGATVTDHVTVTNLGEVAATFDVYAGDGTISPSGDFDLPPGDGRPRDGGAWVRLGVPEGVEGVEAVDDGRLRVALEPGTAVTVPVTVTVPDDATPGDHPAGVVAELVAGDSVRLAARVGARLHLRVAGDVEARLEPADVTTRWEPSWNPFAPGTVHVTYAVRNTGDVRLGARPTTTLAGPWGVGEAEHTVEVREVLPGQETLVEATVRTWPLVRVTGFVDVRPWVVGEDVVDAALQGASVPVTVWTLPWPQLLLVVLVVGAVLLVRWWRRRSAAKVQARIEAAVAAATSAAVQDDRSAEAPDGEVEASGDGAGASGDGAGATSGVGVPGGSGAPSEG